MQGGDNANEWYAINNFEGVPMIRMNLFSETEVAQNDVKSAISLYPNPANDVLIIDNASDRNNFV